ncbi:hypothetical protein [Mycobacteroides abscessus]|uniref:hypothetical protein n=1 Tax=Mycobacteroides abscessus TaxID=36809 RepID=UPI00092C84AC|nr:hypothetical protein [Mycobacteroides abscessus]MEC4836079.1 hypothetical protein [Mycobacteroides chelonae]PVB03164.1 hypothetical protein DDJ51_13110 [Mycobacteroides abscessus]SIJ20758.1 Uncharacterised protein [Mycobacteroides abscessus subsp. abscessus]SKF73520.1 Uncharacterised protein [Mycobacteroides abscessus subsp. massiliense]
MTTNDIERAVNALLDLSGRLVRSFADQIEVTSKAVDTDKLVQRLTGGMEVETNVMGIHATVSSEDEPPETVSVETLMRCAYCKASLIVRTGHSPFEAWICQACARTWHNWDGVAPTVAARLRVKGAGDRR